MYSFSFSVDWQVLGKVLLAGLPPARHSLCLSLAERNDGLPHHVSAIHTPQNKCCPDMLQSLRSLLRFSNPTDRTHLDARSEPSPPINLSMASTDPCGPRCIHLAGTDVSALQNVDLNGANLHFSGRYSARQLEQVNFTGATVHFNVESFVCLGSNRC